MKVDKVCVKCGYDDTVMAMIKIGTKYHSNDDDFDLVFDYLGKKIPVEYSNWRSEIKQECIKVHCRTCQYSWVSDTMDATTPFPNAFNMSEEEIDKTEDELQKIIDATMSEEVNGSPTPFIPERGSVQFIPITDPGSFDRPLTPTHGKFFSGYPRSIVENFHKLAVSDGRND